MEHPDATAWQIISGFMGSVIPVALANKVTARKAVVYIFVGGVVSYYCAPAISHWTHLETAELKSFIGFVTGLLGVQISHALLTYFQSARIQAFLTRILSKVGTGDPNGRSNSSLRN